MYTFSMSGWSQGGTQFVIGNGSDLLSGFSIPQFPYGGHLGGTLDQKGYVPPCTLHSYATDQDGNCPKGKYTFVVMLSFLDHCAKNILHLELRKI